MSAISPLFLPTIVADMFCFHQIMHRNATSCESRLSKLKVHDARLQAELRAEISVEDHQEPEVKARFDQDVADARARYHR